MKKISVDEAVEKLCALAQPPKTERVSLFEAQGRVLADDVTAAINVPPFDRSPYDGYALRGADTAAASRETPVTLRVVEELPAGRAPTEALTAGTASKILTGAPVPEGADAIVKFEDTAFTDDTVTLFAPVPPDTDIVYAGEDVREGTLLAGRGTVITPGIAGVFAGQGMGEIRVYRRPRAVVISTGSELLEAGEPYEPAKIYNSNTVTVSAYLALLGVDAVSGGSVPDDPDLIAQKIDKALREYDLVVTTGGASVGDYDYAGRAAERAGARLLFWKIAMKPGGSVVASEKDGKLILALSGNPGAALTTLLRVASPYIRRACGRKDWAHEPVEVVLKEDFPKKSPQQRLVRGRISIEDGTAFFVSLDGQGNGVVSSFIGCDALGEIPAGSPPLAAGEKIKAYRI
ncbi:MAG: molybdopterin molybdotransferase MoeA [Oscillospiraceae bacterium]|nr:molybdopterin molybdotransferase MoeA [Oscillospiraceae bacterium]